MTARDESGEHRAARLAELGCGRSDRARAVWRRRSTLSWMWRMGADALPHVDPYVALAAANDWTDAQADEADAWCDVVVRLADGAELPPLPPFLCAPVVGAAAAADPAPAGDGMACWPEGDG